MVFVLFVVTVVAGPNRMAGRQKIMRLIAWLLLATLGSGMAEAQTGQGSSPEPAAPRSAETDADAAGDSPEQAAALRRIREALSQPAPTVLQTNVEGTATFRVEIRERRKMEDLLSTLDFRSGPAPPGGLYAYERQQVVNPPSSNPLAQPYAAFNQTELAIVSAQSILNTLLARYFAKGIARAYDSYQERAARAKVDRSIAEYCASREDRGVGIPMCEPSAALGSR